MNYIDNLEEIIAKIPFPLAELERMECNRLGTVFTSIMGNKISIKIPLDVGGFFQIAQRTNLMKVEINDKTIAFNKATDSCELKCRIVYMNNSNIDIHGLCIFTFGFLMMSFFDVIGLKYLIFSLGILIFTNILYIKLNLFGNINFFRGKGRLIQYPSSVLLDKNGIQYINEDKKYYILWDDIYSFTDATFYIKFVTKGGKRFAMPAGYADGYGHSYIIKKLLNESGLRKRKNLVWIGPITMVYYFFHYLLGSELGGEWINY